MIEQSIDLQPFLPHEKVREILGDFEQSIDLCIPALMARPQYNRKYGFPYITKECAQALSALIGSEPTLDAGSGTGFISQELCRLNPTAQVVAAEWDGEKGYGFAEIFKRDHHGDAVALLPGQFRFVLLSWPNYDSPFALNVANAMAPGQILIYQGEHQGGCTANDDFFEVLEREWDLLPKPTSTLNQHHHQFAAIHDVWMVLQKQTP